MDPINYSSHLGGISPVDFETAILDGFAADGGLYVPSVLPQVSPSMLAQWKGLGYVDLAFELLSLFIDTSSILASELRQLLQTAYADFTHDEIIPLHPLKSQQETYIMELFHGPTLSFKDVGLAFLVNLFQFFLERRQERRTIIVATTGDTGPACAHFAAGKTSLEAWVLYPQGMISPEQERQMTTLTAGNVQPVGVSDCPDGGDDLDLVIARLFADKDFVQRHQLSSVNSINWGRVMMQTVHYFYGYLQLVDRVGEEINISVPSGAFGNLCAGAIARKMGLPVRYFVVANGHNACLHRIFSEGVFSKQPIHETVASAIDILLPYNFWRYLHFATNGQQPTDIRRWMQEVKTGGSTKFDATTHDAFAKGFLSCSTADEEILQLINEIYRREHYLLDPHGAVALAAANAQREKLGDLKLLCLATAHPAKFPKVIQRAIGAEALPAAARHPSIEAAKARMENGHHFSCAQLEELLRKAMEETASLR
ncbi:MAG: threonine synthase [Bacteroidota bacterium]